ncbi:MAG TPA: STAS domain-containing protein [Frankiaceae bacterium]|nr:STAS domain-containing protein [Frankiaceae bacterium]
MTAMLAPPDNCAGHRTLSPLGDLDLATAPQLRQDLVDASTSDSTLVVLDLEGVEFLDSVGLSVIIGGHKRLQRRGARLHLAGPRSIVRRVLSLTRVDSLIPTYDTVADAESGCPAPAH